MQWGTFKYFLEKDTKKFIQNSFACKTLFGKKDVQSFSKVVFLAPSYKF
jgi:hypothetical protein